MANVCYNEFYFRCDKDEEKWSEVFAKLLDEDLYGEVTYEADGIIEGYFESRWTFPTELFKSIPFDSSTYFRCLSQEPGCEYFAMNVFKDGGWLGEQVMEV